jgi:acyl-CoA reductase-like NAD-dependent aldehyde dehydrogenase
MMPVAVACGNTFVLAGRESALIATRLAELFGEAGPPTGRQRGAGAARRSASG